MREILLAEGSNHRDGPAVIYRDRREPADLTTMFSQLFLGTRLECAKCHHHPNEKWSQDDFYQFAAFFGPREAKGRRPFAADLRRAPRPSTLRPAAA